jgi:hypothetical protein
VAIYLDWVRAGRRETKAKKDHPRKEVEAAEAAEAAKAAKKARGTADARAANEREIHEIAERLRVSPTRGR